MAGKKTIPAEDPEQPQSAGSMDRTGNPTEKSVRTLRSTVARNCLRPIAYLSNFTLLDNLILLNTQHVTDGIPGHSASDANSGLLPQNLLEDFAIAVPDIVNYNTPHPVSRRITADTVPAPQKWNLKIRKDPFHIHKQGHIPAYYAGRRVSGTTPGSSQDYACGI